VKTVRASNKLKKWYMEWYGLNAESITFSDGNVYNIYNELMVKQKI